MDTGQDIFQGRSIIYYKGYVYLASATEGIYVFKALEDEPVDADTPLFEN